MPAVGGGVAEQIAELRRQKDKAEEQMQAAVDNDDTPSCRVDMK